MWALEIAADTTPAKVAVRVDGTGAELSYGELVGRGRSFAAALARSGVGQGDRVVLFLRASLDYAVALLGVHLAGAVAVTVNISSSVDELVYTINACGGSRIVTAASGEPLPAGLLKALGPDVGAIDVESVETGEDDLPDVSIGPDDLATIIFTSGTTDRPKGVLLSHGNLVWCTDIGRAVYGYTSDDVGLLLHAINLTHGLNYQLITWLAAGATVVIVPHFSASGFNRQIHQHGITVTTLNAFHVRAILATKVADGERDHGLRFVKLGTSSSLTEEHLADFERRFDTRLAGGTYASTETVTYVLATPLAPADLTHRKRGGLPVPGYDVRLLDDDGRDVDVGVPGEIALRCNSRFGLCVGYVGDLAGERTEWWRTGDLGVSDEDGFIEFVERSKDMIKRAGYNISPAEVERVLIDHATIREAAVVGVPDAMYDERIVAYVVPEVSGVADGDSLREYCASRLSPYKVPDAIVVRADLPRGAVGKIDKIALRSIALGR